jgi:arylsulfatase
MIRKRELKELFWAEAERYKVLPLLATLSTFFGMLPPLPEQTRFEFRGDVQNVLSGMIPRIYNHSYAISADLVVPEGGAGGVIVAEADHLGGFSLFVSDGKLTHTYSMMGVFIYRQQTDHMVREGAEGLGAVGFAVGGCSRPRCSPRPRSAR